MFINHSNHNSKNWSEKQRMEAKRYGEVVDITFPDIKADADKNEVKKLARKFFGQINEKAPDMVMCQGEFCYTFEMVRLLKEAGIPVCAACSERKAMETIAEKHTVKESVFEFVQFREY